MPRGARKRDAKAGDSADRKADRGERERPFEAAEQKQELGAKSNR